MGSYQSLEINANIGNNNLSNKNANNQIQETITLMYRDKHINKYIPENPRCYIFNKLALSNVSNITVEESTSLRVIFLSSPPPSVQNKNLKMPRK